VHADSQAAASNDNMEKQRISPGMPLASRSPRSIAP
jgi:hypothetical protein